MTENQRKQIHHGTLPDAYPRGREIREVAGVVILVTGPDAPRLANLFAALVPKLPRSDRRSIGALVLVECDPEDERGGIPAGSPPTSGSGSARRPTPSVSPGSRSLPLDHEREPGGNHA